MRLDVTALAKTIKRKKLDMYDVPFEVGTFYIIKRGYIQSDENDLGKEIELNNVFLVLEYSEVEKKVSSTGRRYLLREFTALFKHGISRVFIQKSVNDYEELV